MFGVGQLDQLGLGQLGCGSIIIGHTYRSMVVFIWFLKYYITSCTIAGVGTYDSLCTNFNYYQLFRDFHFFGGCRASGYV